MKFACWHCRYYVRPTESQGVDIPVRGICWIDREPRDSYRVGDDLLPGERRCSPDDHCDRFELDPPPGAPVASEPARAPLGKKRFKTWTSGRRPDLHPPLPTVRSVSWSETPLGVGILVGGGLLVFWLLVIALHVGLGAVVNYFASPWDLGLGFQGYCDRIQDQIDGDNLLVVLWIGITTSVLLGAGAGIYCLLHDCN